MDLEVKSMSGISIWSATVDFNDFGHLTGWYKAWSENDDSRIPDAFAREVNELISECRAACKWPPRSLCSRQIPRLARAVDAHVRVARVAA